MDSPIVVTPVKTGVQEFYNYFNLLDSDFRWNDENGLSATFCETVYFDHLDFVLSCLLRPATSSVESILCFEFRN